MNIRVASRGSRLALWQAHHVAELLRAATPSLAVEIVVVETTGDIVVDRPLSQIGGDGLFTKEIQRAVLERRADIAVHSMKDLPTQPAPGIVLAAVPPRGATGDAFISKKHARIDELPHGAVVATSSLRRRAQVLWKRPDLQLTSMRGNVETRLRKLEEGAADALVLAQAGLERLGLASAIASLLDQAWMLPAVGQGALALECRVDDTFASECLQPLNDPASALAVRAEREFLRVLGGGCLLPVGATVSLKGTELALRGVLLDADGKQRLEGQVQGSSDDPEDLGRRLAEDLLKRGGTTILQALRFGESTRC
jgi:hydroxymethylbilane synthase